MHEKKISHRDIKPNNVIITPSKQGYYKTHLIDFGFAIKHRYGQEYLNCGTPLFMPPEIHMNKSYHASSADVWSLGVVFYHLVIGRNPFGDNSSSREEIKKRIT